MDNLDPVTKLIMDANGDRSSLTPEQRAEREQIDRIEAAKAKVRPAPALIEELRSEHTDARWFAFLLDHYLFTAYSIGRVDGSAAVADALQDEVAAKLAKYTDNGDGVPLAVIGPGGDFNREVRP
jgi:hypothetical protein